MKDVIDEMYPGGSVGCLWTAVIVILLATLVLSVYFVPAGHVGVITQWGAVHRVVYPGMGFRIPVKEGIRKIEVRTQVDKVDASAASKDLQVVTSTVALNYHLESEYADWIYQNIGMDYQNKIIAPAVQNTFKAVTAQFSAEQLITKREEARLRAEEELAKQLAVYHIVVDNFNIVNFDFSPEFNAAIEAKQVAQQQVETAKQRLAQAEVDAKTAITQAEGQAEAQAAMKESGSLTPEYLQWFALTKWDGHLPAVTGGATPFIDVTSFSQNLSGR